MADPEFFLALQKLMLPLTAENLPCDHGAEDIYDKILPNLKGTRDFGYENGVDFITDQRSGTCSWKSLMKLLLVESHDTTTYKQFIFNLRLDTLKAYVEKCKSQEPSDEQLQLLKRAMENFGRLALKQQKISSKEGEGEIVDEIKFEEAEELITAIRHFVSERELKPPQDQLQELNLEKTVPFDRPLIPASLGKPPIPCDTATRATAISSAAPLISFTQPTTLEELNSLVDRILLSSAELQAKGAYHETVEAITHFMTSLGTLGVTSRGLFDKLCRTAAPEEIEEAMGKIYKVNQLLFSAISHLPVSERGSPDHFALQTLLMAINEKLSRNIDEDHHPRQLKFACTMANESFLEKLMMNSYAVINNPKLRILFEEAKAFLLRKRGDFTTPFYSRKYSLERLEFDQSGKSENRILQSILDSSKFRERINATYPELNGAPDSQIIEYAYSTWNKPECPLPKSYRILVEQAMLCHYFDENPHLQNLTQLGEEPGNLNIQKVNSFRSTDIYRVTMSGIKSLGTEEYKEFYEHLHCEFKELTPLEHPGLASLLGRYPEIDIHGIDQHHVSWSSGSSQAVTMEQLSGLTRRETQELAFILSNRVTLVPNLIAYFKEHSDKLLDREYQLFFYLALFSGNHCNTIVKNSPELAEKVTSFLTEQYGQQKAMGNSSQQLFFLWVLETFSEIVPQGKESPTLLLIKKELKVFISSIEEKNLSGKRNKALAYQQWIATFHNRRGELSEEECRELCKAYCYVKAIGFDSKLSHPTITQRMQETMAHVASKIEALEPTSQEILTREIVQEVIGEAEDRYQVDLATFTLCNRNNIIGALPDFVVKDAHFQELFCDKSFVVRSQKPGIYEFSCMEPSDTKPSKYRVFLNSEGSLTIQKIFWGGNWFTYCPEETLGNSFKPQGLLHGKLHWMGKIANQSMMILEEKSDRREHSTIYLKEQGGQLSVDTWNKPSQGSLQNIYDSSSPFNALKRFQPIETIFLWEKASLEFSTLGIKFEGDGKGNLQYGNDPNFFLAEEQTPPTALPRLSSYLKLQDKEGQIKYLIPKGQFDRAQFKGGSFSRDVAIDLENTCQFIEISEKQGKLVGKTAAENLYLAAIHLAHKDYMRASAYLTQPLAGAPQGYSEEENEVLVWVNTLIKEGGDNSPEAVAVALRIAYLQVRNAPESQSSEQKNATRTLLEPLLESYYPIAHHTKIYPVTASEELELLNFCLEEGSLSSPLQARYEQLIASTSTLGKAITPPASKEFQLHSDYRMPQLSVAKLLQESQIELAEVDAPIPTKEEQEKLKALFTPEEGGSKLEKLEFGRVQESITAYFQEIAGSRRYEISDEQLSKLTGENGVLQVEIDRLNEIARTQKIEILKLVNKYPENGIEALRRSVKESSGVKKNLLIDDLLILYLQNNNAALSKRNSALTPEEIANLGDLLTEYLMYATESAHLCRVQKWATKASTEESPPEKEKFLQELNTALRSERNYLPKKDEAISVEARVMLVFEHYGELRLREKQVETIRSMTLDKIQATKNQVIQLIMASGKSKVISPLLNYLNSTGNNIPIHCVPASLYETNLSDARIFSGERLGQPVETFSFAKNELFTVAKCDEILKKFQTVKENRSYLLISDETAKTLYLHCKSLLVELADCKKNGQPISEDLSARYEKAKEILFYLKNQADLLIDEVDLVLNCMNEMNFSSGTRSPISKEVQSTLQEVFFRINGSPELKDFFSLDCETQKLFDKQVYREEIQPQLIELFLEMTGCNTMGESEKAEVKKYLYSDRNHKIIPECIKGLSEEARDQLALGKELIQTLFPLLLQKNRDEHFGLSHDYPSNMAIPYAGKNQPSEGSEFSSPYETLLYTMVYFTRKGVSEKQVSHLIATLKASALAENRAYGTPFKETEGYRKFQELNLTQNKDLFTFQESEIAGAVTSFNSNMENRMKFAREYGWSEVGIYAERISCTSQNWVDIYHTIQGFAGTLCNKDTFHHKIKTIPDKATDGKTLYLIDRMKPAVSSFDLSTNGLDLFFKSLSTYDACIDAGNWFRGMDAVDVAKRINTELPDKIKGVVYLNDKDIPPGSKGQIVLLEKGKEQPQLLSHSKLKPEERFTYYNVTTGVDIEQHDFAKAMVSVSRTETLRETLQGVWRMRGLESEQKIDFSLPEELSRDLGDESADVILKLICKTQAQTQEKENPHALKQKISGEIESLIDHICWDPGTPIELAARIAESLRPLLVRLSSQQPSILFGNIVTDEAMTECIDFSIKEALNGIRALYEEFLDFDFGRTLSLEKLEEKLRALADKMALPEKEMMPVRDDGQPSSNNYGVAVQIRQQVKSEQKAKTKSQIEVVDDTYQSTRQKDPVPWKEARIFNKNCWEEEKSGPRCQPVNSYLQGKSKLLIDVDTMTCFSSQLMMSSNFRNASAKSIPFQSGQMPVGSAALRKDRSTGELHLIFLHPMEAEMIWKLLDEGIHNRGYCDYDLVLLNPDLGIVKRAANGITEAELQQDPHYIELIVQGKFYNGNLDNYSPAEREYLKEWIAKVGVEEMETLLLKNILRVREADAIRYPHSVLKGIFDAVKSDFSMDKKGMVQMRVTPR
jgi:hypothetical protein